MAEITVEVSDHDLMADVSTERVKYYQLPKSIEGFDIACEILSLDGILTGFIGKFDSDGEFVYGLACGERPIEELDDASDESDDVVSYESEEYAVITVGEYKGELGVLLNEVKREGHVVSYVVELSDDVIVTIDVDHVVKIKE